MQQQRITPNLWFDGNAEEAAAFYCSLFEDARIVSKADYPENGPGPAGTVMVVEWEIEGQRFVGINGGPQFPFSEAISLQINCDTQEEIDRLWQAITADGGEEGQCGWCRDRFGVSWQVTPRGMDDVFSHPDKGRAERAMQAMLKMTKIDLAELERAADGEGVPA